MIDRMKQQVEFVRFLATDDVELQGWLYDSTGKPTKVVERYLAK
jgi:hypothetical protein